MSGSSTVGHGTARGRSQNPQCSGAGKEGGDGETEQRIITSITPTYAVGTVSPMSRTYTH